MSRRSKLITFGLPLLAIVAGGAAIGSITRHQPVKQSVAPITSPPVQPASLAITRGRGFVGAAGIVEPAGEQTAIGAHVSGIVSKVLVVPGKKVKAGDALFVIDERAAAAQVSIRRTELAAAERRLEQTLARIPSLTATRDAARAGAAALKAEMEDWQDQLRSADALKAHTTAAITDREVTRRRNGERAARNRLAEAEARALQADAELDMIARTKGAPSVEVERANVAQAKAAAERAEVDLELLTVRAPIDGTVLQVNVRAGEFAPAGLVTTPLIVMGNLDPLNVRVDIDEIDVGLFRPEAQAFASLRGQAERRASLTFVRIDPIVVPKKSLTGAATERVDTRVLRVVYALPPDTLPAYSGQQVDVFIAAPQPATAADASK